MNEKLKPEVNYVAGFLFSHDLLKIALIQKERPRWQQGKLNGIGGHIEELETSAEAMRREFREEASLDIVNWKQFAMLCDKSGKWSVDWFWSRLLNGEQRKEHELKTVTDEIVGWYSVEAILGRQYWTVIPNLLWLIPMALNDIHGQDSCTLFTIMEVQRRR